MLVQREVWKWARGMNSESSQELLSKCFRAWERALSESNSQAAIWQVEDQGKDCSDIRLPALSLPAESKVNQGSSHEEDALDGDNDAIALILDNNLDRISEL